jgi:uncharacterized protein (DUF302 family)
MKITRIIMMVLFSMMTLWANEDLLVYKVDNSQGKITPKTIEKSLVKSGYIIPKNRDMNGPFKKQFEKTTFDTYNLMIAYHDKMATKLVIKHENAGVFVPFSVAIYQKKGDKFLYVSFLTAKAQSKILGIQEPLLDAIEKENKKAFLTALPGAVEEKLSFSVQATDKKLLTSFEVEVEDDDAEELKDELEMVLESGLKPIGFIKASFSAFGMDLEEANNEDYEFYDAYSLCKLKVIYNVALQRPEAGAFAPCTLAIYHKVGSNKTKIVFPNVYNWIATLDIKDKALIALLEKAQSDIVTLLKSAIE